MSALNFDDDEKRTDVHFNKALKTEAPSAYYFGINKDADPLNLDQETGVRKRFEENIRRGDEVLCHFLPSFVPWHCDEP